MFDKRLFLTGILVSLIIVLGCAPKVSSPQPAPASQAAPVAVASASNLSSITPQDAAWDKVVATAKKEGVLTIYSTSFVADTGRRLANDFQNRYGIRVEVLASSGRTSLEKIKVEQQIKKPIADVMQSSAGSVTELFLSGLAASVWKELPVMQDKSAFLVDPLYSPGGELVQHNLYFTAPAINTRVVKPQDEPKSFKDMLEPRWKGNMAAADPAATGSTALFYLPIYYKALDLDYWRSYARQDINIWGGSSAESARMLGRGEWAFYLANTTDVYGPLVAEGAPIKMLDMKEGTGAAGHFVVAIKDSPHPNAAKLFINWLLTPEGQLAYVEPTRGTAIRKGMPDFSIQGTKLNPPILWSRTWEFEEWSNKEIKLGNVAKIFGKQ
ncbi:MAG: extracellular solute-binding protein [Dehalococcoidia bacterium]|nr:extracellular solute-binding protein [Dehalococcoidia bacterium]